MVHVLQPDTEEAVDLCDVLASFNSQRKTTLHKLCRGIRSPRTISQ
jgi:hypothetical protein